MLSDPVAAGKRQEQIAVETACGTKVGILDLCVMAKLCSPGAGLETLLAAHGRLAFEQHGKPFAVIEAASDCASSSWKAVAMP
ncbi:hypothetical protein X729_32160 [Mesorhizobium sp. L103C131B0]|nr:hypothetical protein X729_32160 [Mesorhizobium sp. L103C131B0]